MRRQGVTLINWRRLTFALLCGSAILAAYILYLKLDRIQQEPLLVLAPLLATLGWMASIYVSRSNERRKFTIDLVLRHQMDRTIDEHKNRISATFPPFTKLTDQNAADILTNYRAWKTSAGQASTDTIPVGYSIIQVLNFYEFIAVNVREERLDEAVAYDSFRALSRNMVDKFRPLITKSRTVGDDGKRPMTYRHLVWLSRRWHGIDLDA
jgi:hypothetical protein